MEHESKFDFSANLKEAIRRKGVNQAWLAAQTGITRSTITRYMQSSHKPQVDVLIAIAKALGVSLDYLVGLSPDLTPYKVEPEKAALTNAFARADEEHKRLVWSVLDSYLTPEEKTVVEQQNQQDALAS